MSKRRGGRHKILGISDRGWSTIGTGFKWWLIAGGITLGAVLVVGLVGVTVVAAKGGFGGAPPVQILGQ